MNSIISINLDSFIYAVRQAFDARSRAHGEFNSHLKYTPFLENTWEKPEDVSLSSLEQPLNEIFVHHWKAIPHYQRHEAVNLENISWFAHSMAALFADINYLLKNTLGHGIPEQNAEEGNESAKIWTLINKAVQTHFKEYAPLFYAYAEWKYNPPSEKKEVIDWNVRPPCGLLYRTEFKALFDEIRNERYGKKSSHSKTDRKHNDNHKKEKSSGHERNSGPERNSREKGAREKREPKHLVENSEHLLKPALEECKKAIETMKNNPNIHEIPLSAQNSFIRRHQHTFITEAGFDSDSRGEGTGRHVCIVKKS